MTVTLGTQWALLRVYPLVNPALHHTVVHTYVSPITPYLCIISPVTPLAIAQLDKVVEIQGVVPGVLGFALKLEEDVSEGM